jgi:SAM-dependent methyltransferase
MVALLIGRFHALTRAHAEFLTAVAADATLTRIACVITSADHAGTRRNPLSVETREAILRPALVPTGKPFQIVPVADIPDDAAWVAHVRAALASAGCPVEPAGCVVLTANSSVAALFVAAGFRIARARADVTPHELIQRVVADRPWRDLAAPSTIAVFTDELIARLKAIYSDRLRTDDGELAAHRDFDTYGGQMDASLVQKLDDLVPWIVPGRIVDKGCGTGKLLVELSRRFPESALVGVDLSRELLRRCDENTFAGGDIELLQGDAAAQQLPDGSASTVIFSSVLHEVYSYKGYDLMQVDRALASAAAELRRGGRLLIRDGVSPGEGTWRMRFVSDGAARQFTRFAVEFKHGQGAPHQRLSADEVRLPAHFANEFLCKKDYLTNWAIEVHEEFGLLPADAWPARLEAVGVRPLAVRAYVSDWIASHRYQGTVELRDAEGAALGWPATNVVVVGEKR